MIYLASASPRRREILKALGIRFRRIGSSYEEKNPRHSNPRQLVLLHAKNKALHAKVPRKGTVLTADTLVWCDGHVLGKPKSMKEAERMLKRLSGRFHSVYTGLALMDCETRKIKTACVQTRVKIKKLSSNEIRDYFRRVPPFDKAGAYAIQMKPRIAEKIKGSYSNVVGLPIEALKKLLKEI